LYTVGTLAKQDQINISTLINKYFDNEELEK